MMIQPSPTMGNSYRRHRRKAAPGECGTLRQELAILDELRLMQLELRRPPKQLERLHVVVRALVTDTAIPAEVNHAGL